MQTKPCRVCGADVFWWKSPAARWQQYAAVPISFDGSPGLALHRKRGLIDAGSAWPEPTHMFPAHWHPKRKETGPYALSDVLDEWLTQPKPRKALARHSVVS